MKKLTLPLTKADVKHLKAGDTVLISGVVYTARDCAHKRIFQLLDAGEKLPFELSDATIYYAGPCPAKPGMASGSCGPTTSARIIDLGLNSIIGKGEMNAEVAEALKRNGAVYFAAIGGAGALYGKNIKSSKCVAFPDLMSEAVYRLEIEDFPAVVAIDAEGESVFARR